MKSDWIKLIEIVTLEDIDGCFFNRRMDTGQIIYPEDLNILKIVDFSDKIRKAGISPEDFGYLPRSIVPKNANSIFYSRQKMENSILDATYFCKLIEKPDEGFRRIAKGEIILPKVPRVRGNFSGKNLNMNFFIY